MTERQQQGEGESGRKMDRLVEGTRRKEGG